MTNEMILVDLHSHTTASDGRLSPSELVCRAIDNGVQILAITDHDTVAGLAEAHQANQQHLTPLTLINGIEISTRWQSFDIHIVALNIDPTNEKLLNFLENQRELRECRAKEIGVRLAKAGILNAYEETKRLAKDAAVSRGHFARFLIDKGFAIDNVSVFKRYLAKGKIGYVPNNWECMKNAIDIIHQAGGVAVLAHPSAYKLSMKWLKRLVREFTESGGDAMEVVTGQQSIDDRANLCALSHQHKLFVSLGSDFHGPGSWIDVGKNLFQPPGLPWIWQQFWTEKQ